MNEDIKDMLLDLEDEGYTVTYNKGGNGAAITYEKRNFKIREVKHIIQRLFDYNQDKNFYLQITTQSRIMGAKTYRQKRGMKDIEFSYEVFMDINLYDALYVKRGRYTVPQDVPLYIKNNTEIRKINFQIFN